MATDDEVQGGDEHVVLASFPNRSAAERMVSSLGRNFRKVARKGRASALVVSANPDRSLKLTQSRAETGSDVTAAVIALPVVWTAGLVGMFSMLKAGKRTASAAHVRESHVGDDEQAAHALLADAGAHSALVLFRCRDNDLWLDIATRADERAVHSWRGTMTEFRAALDPGSQHDWVRAALDKTAGR
jgi:hypothetical protein